MYRPGQCFFASSITTTILLGLFTVGGQNAAAQEVPPSGNSGGEVSSQNLLTNLEPVNITISIRDARGLPIEEVATVRLSSNLRRVFRNLDTRESADISVMNVLQGPYDVMVECPGYRPVQEHLDVSSGAAFFRTYIYLHALSDSNTANQMPKGLALSPKAVNEIDKGLAAMRKRDYPSAEKHFSKAANLSPANSDVYYLRGNAEIRMDRADSARKDFEQAVKLEPNHNKALSALGELQLKAGDMNAAIATLNRTVTANGAGWRTYYLLSSAYANLKQWKEADLAAQRAVALAGPQAATPLLVMGEIRLAGGDEPKAREVWQKIVTNYPTAAEAVDAKAKLAELDSGTAVSRAGGVSAIKIASQIDTMEESRPWAPPDTDAKAYAVMPEVACDLDDVLARGMRRLRTQMSNLEKFTAIEHIEHQEIDKGGLAGAIKSRQFSYIVFVNPYQKESVFLEESRDGGMTLPSFPTSLATTGLNSLGVSILQPVYRIGFDYRCEGVATVRGQAAWQVRFEEKQGAKAGVRRWQREGTIYNIPIRGRIWLSTTTFDIVRVESELREPVTNLELTRDHLEVEYGPVSFNSAGTQLWLPWSAEMYTELHGKRYHHKHYLTDYLLFGVDTASKIKLPKEATEEEGAPAAPPKSQQ